MKFKSKKDWWLALVIWGSAFLSFGSGLLVLTTDTPDLGSVIEAVPLVVLIPFFILWMWLTTFYILDESCLIIRYGPFKKMIPLHTIRSVKKTNNPLSSPALSLQRIEISYGKYDSILISPYDRDEFINILVERCPKININ